MKHEPSVTDELLQRVADLTVHDIDDLRRERIRRRAKTVLTQRCQDARRSADSISTQGGFSARYLEPALVSAFSIMVLAWTIERTLFILR